MPSNRMKRFERILFFTREIKRTTKRREEEEEEERYRSFHIKIAKIYLFFPLQNENFQGGGGNKFPKEKRK